MTSNQIGLPSSVSIDELTCKKTLGSALQLCANIGGFDFDKQLQIELGVDKSQFSRWLSGQEGIIWPKFVALMDACKNDAPLLWMLHQRGYEVRSVRRRESKLEEALRKSQEENAALRRVLMGGAA